MSYASFRRALAAVLVTALFSGCGQKENVSVHASSPPPAPAAPIPTPVPPTEADLVAELRRGYAANKLLPEHFVLRAAPFEIVTSAPPRYTLQGKLVVEALEASYTPVTTVYNSAGKKLTVVRCVARKGETFEVPFTLQVNFDGQRFGEGAAPPLGRAVGDFGAPLASFVNGFDVATEVGRRLRDAPKVVAEAEQAVRTAEVSLRKTYLDLLKKALDNNASLLDELGALKGLYPETDDMFSHSFAQPRGKVEAQIREFLAPRFSADYEKFYGEYDAAKQRVEETKRFLDDL